MTDLKEDNDADEKDAANEIPITMWSIQKSNSPYYLGNALRFREAAIYVPLCLNMPSSYCTFRL